MAEKQTRNIDIMMLGPRRVGKTSLLASMWRMFREETRGANLYLNPAVATAARLEELLDDLRSMPRLIEFGYGEDRGGIEPTSQAGEAYQFDLGRDAQRLVFHLRMHDFPGEWMNNNVERLSELLRVSAIVLVAVDAVALMASKGEWDFLHEHVNKPQLITPLFQEAFGATTVPRLVIFALVKAERWLKDPQARSSILDRVKHGYHDTLQVLGSGQAAQNVAVVITPVQTIGTLVFEGMRENPDTGKRPGVHNYSATFRRIEGQRRFDPQDTEQPLRYLLRFLIAQHLNFSPRTQRPRGFWESLWQDVVEFLDMVAQGLGFSPGEVYDAIYGAVDSGFKTDLVFRDAALTFAQGCKALPPFAVLQGQHLLAVPDRLR